MTKLRAFRRFAEDNRGSAVLTVVVTMLFVVALGTALLYTAYRGLQLSVLARNDKENFYDASAAMDEIKAGVQDEVSTAIQTAYTETLVDYGKGDMKNIAGEKTSDPQEAFRDSFLTALGKSEVKAFKVYYDAALRRTSVKAVKNILKSFAKPENGAVLALSDGVDTFDAVVGDDGLSFKKLELTCVSADGYESQIATDLEIAIPKFFTGSAVSSGIGQYVIIADKGIKATTTGPKTITGGVYAGADGISVLSSGGLALTGGKVVTAGSISAYEDTSGKMDTTLAITPGTYDIWAREINVGKNSKAAFDGNIYVADDLVIGGGSTVTLRGRYYGFGSDDAETAGRSDEKSSSIFVNSYVSGKSATLNIDGLKQLSLAGVSFINVRENTNADSNIATGESVAAKPDQLAYLVPAEAIKNYKTNPTVLKKNESGLIIAPKINTAAVLWSIDGKNKTLAEYIGDSNVADDNYAGTYGSLVTYYTQGAENIGYTFINFTDQTKANQYFKDYFTAKPDSIKQYLDIYLDLSTYNPSMSSIAKGNTYRDSGKWENILGSAAFPDSQAKYYESMYEKLSISPMAEYVNMDKLKKLDGTLEFKDVKGKNVAVVSDGNVTYDDNYFDLNYDIRIIIAAGNVNVSKPFNGIIIAGGTVTVNNTVSYKVPTSEVLTSKTADGKVPLSDYLNEDVFNGEKSTSDNEWSPDKLVYYRNWQKN